MAGVLAVQYSAQVADTIASEYLKDSNTAPLVPLDTAEALKEHGVHLTFPFERDPSLTQDKLRACAPRTHARMHATLLQRYNSVLPARALADLDAWSSVLVEECDKYAAGEVGPSSK